MKPVTQKQAHRRYMQLSVPAMVLYLAGIFAVSYGRRVFDPAPLWLSVASWAVIVLPLWGFLLVWLRYTRETDEFQSLQLLWGFAIAGCITAGAAFAIGFAQMLGIAPQFDTYWYGVVFMMTQGLTLAVRGGKCLP